jgi:hypothetical protein
MAGRASRPLRAGIAANRSMLKTCWSGASREVFETRVGDPLPFGFDTSRELSCRYRYGNPAAADPV